MLRFCGLIFICLAVYTGIYYINKRKEVFEMNKETKSMYLIRNFPDNVKLKASVYAKARKESVGEFVARAIEEEIKRSNCPCNCRVRR